MVERVPTVKMNPLQCYFSIWSHFGLWEGREKRRRGGWRGETRKAYQPYLEIKKENLNNGKENDTKF